MCLNAFGDSDSVGVSGPHRKTHKCGQQAHVGWHTNVQVTWKHKQMGNIDLSVAEEPVLYMKYRDFHFLIEKSPLWTEIWSIENSKFHDGDLET